MTGSMTPVYGMTSNVYTKGAVAEFLKGLLDLVFEVKALNPPPPSPPTWGRKGDEGM